jgi:adenosylcobinamide-phosphate synthase
MLPRLIDLNPDFSIGALAHGPEPLFLLLLALALDAAMGHVLRRAMPSGHPDRLIEALVRSLERRLNRESRSAATRLIRGLLLVVFVLAIAAVVALAISLVAGLVPFGWAIVLVVLLALISQHRPFVAARGVVRTLEALPAGAREDAGQDLALLSAHSPHAGTTRDTFASARGAAERLAGGYAFGLVGAVLWFALLGLPGLILYRTIAILGRELDETQPRTHHFGLTPTRMYEAINWLPVPLAAVLLAVAAAFVPGARPRLALATMTRGTQRHVARGAAWPIAALAGALGLSLAGPRPLDQGSGALVPWIGPTGGRAKVVALDLRKALFLYAVACLLNAALVIAATMVWLAA